jgi:hypothetical protein
MHRTSHQPRFCDFPWLADVNELDLGIADKFGCIVRRDSFDNRIRFGNELFRGRCCIKHFG